MKTSIKEKQNKEKLSNAYSEFDIEDALAIDPAVVSEIKRQGKVHRWINAKTLKDNYGYDARRWVPFKYEGKMTEAFGFTDSEGFIRRGDLVLAVRDLAVAAAHKAKLDRKNKTLAAAQDRVAADELRKKMREAKIDSLVVDGFDEDEE